jgi:hypothetical protein
VHLAERGPLCLSDSGCFANDTEGSSGEQSNAITYRQKAVPFVPKLIFLSKRSHDSSGGFLKTHPSVLELKRVVSRPFSIFNAAEDNM